MKNIFFLSLILFSCKQKIPRSKEFQEFSDTINLQLIDSLGNISMAIPKNFDTSYRWIHMSDCGKPCDKEKYRFQPKSYPVIRENGMIWNKPTDSVMRITVSHTLDFPFQDLDTNAIISYNHPFIKKQLSLDPNYPPIIFDTILSVHRRIFSVFYMKQSDSIVKQNILAVTTIKGNHLRIEYELFTKRGDSTIPSFFNKTLKLINTIRVSKGM
ncbi:MAG TPA: hypothetical protein PKK69_00470 [Ferruginibacter sp.]|nr:hypothetical protein [Ferruginibacter sp.]